MVTFQMLVRYSTRFLELLYAPLKRIKTWRSSSKLITTPSSEQGSVIGNTTRHVSNLIKWISAKYQKEIDKRKTERGKGTQKAKLDAILSFFSTNNKNSLKFVFDLQKEIVLAKLILINRLNKLSSVKTFVKTNKGYATTGPEGYVAIDKIGGDALKIVDRLEFSYNNFSPNVLKGWDKGR